MAHIILSFSNYYNQRVHQQERIKVFFDDKKYSELLEKQYKINEEKAQEVNKEVLAQLNLNEKQIMIAMEETGFLKTSLKDSLEMSLTFSRFKPMSTKIDRAQAIQIFNNVTLSSLNRLDKIMEQVSQIDAAFTFCILTFDYALTQYKLEQEDFKSVMSFHEVNKDEAVQTQLNALTSKLRNMNSEY